MVSITPDKEGRWSRLFVQFHLPQAQCDRNLDDIVSKEKLGTPKNMWNKVSLKIQHINLELHMHIQYLSEESGSSPAQTRPCQEDCFWVLQFALPRLYQSSTAL